MPIRKRVSFNLDSVLQLDATVVVNSPETKARTDTKQHPSRPVSFFIDQRFPGDLERHNAFRRNPVGSLSLPSSLPTQTPKNSIGGFLGSRRAVMPTQPTRPERLESASPSKSSKNSPSNQEANSPSNQEAIEISNNALRNQRRTWTEGSKSQTKDGQDIQNSLLFSTPLSDEFSRLRTSQGGPLIEVEQKPPSDEFRRLSASQGVRSTQLQQIHENRIFKHYQEESEKLGIEEVINSSEFQKNREAYENFYRVFVTQPKTDVPQHEPTNSPEYESTKKEEILKCLLTLHHNKGSIKFLGTKEDIEKTNRKLFAFSNIFSRCFRIKDDQEKLEEYVFVLRDKVFLVKCSKQIFDQVNKEVLSSKSEESDSSKSDSISPKQRSMVFGKKQFNSEDGIVKLAIADIEKSTNPLKSYLKSIKKAQEELLSKEDCRKFKESLLEHLLIMSHHYKTAVDLGCVKKKDSSSLNCCFKGKIKKTKDQDSTLQNYFFVLKDQFFVISCSKEDYVRFKNKVIGENKHQSKNVARNDEVIQILDSEISFIADDKYGFKKILQRDMDQIAIDNKLKKRIGNCFIDLERLEIDSFTQSLKNASREVDFKSKKFSVDRLPGSPSDPDARSLSADSESCIYV